MNRAEHADAPAPAGSGAAARRTAHGLLAAAVVVNGAVLVVGTTFAAFSGGSTVAQTSTSGAVSITLSPVGSAEITSGVSGLGAGDYYERLVDVSPGAGLPIASWTLATAATTSSLLDTTSTHGLRIRVDRCSVPWTAGTTDGATTYTCSGTTTAALAEQDVIVSPAAPLSGMGLSVNHLRVTVRLASTASDALQSQASTLAYTFAGVQRAGQAR